MEPLSIAASVVGLLGATAKISKVLSTFVRSAKNAPKLAVPVLREVSDISSSLVQLRSFLLETEAETRPRKAMIMMDQVVVTLTTCVITLSELEAIVDSLNMDQPRQLWARVAWARQEPSVSKLLERLQWSKLSLTLMLTTLTW